MLLLCRLTTGRMLAVQARLQAVHDFVVARMKSEAERAVSESCSHGWARATDHTSCKCPRFIVYLCQARLKEVLEREEKVSSRVHVSCVLNYFPRIRNNSACRFVRCL